MPHILKCTGLPNSDYRKVFSALRLPPYVVGWSDMLLLWKATHFGSFQFPFRMTQTKQTAHPALNFARFLGSRSFRYTHNLTTCCPLRWQHNMTAPETATKFLTPEREDRMKLARSFSALPHTSALPQEACSSL